MTNKISIFLADDDADDCMLFEDALREVSEATELTTASDGVELIKLMEDTVLTKPDVIFLDLNMPRKNGIECLQYIKSHVAWKDIPVVIFSTTGQEETVRKTFATGANFFIKKPGSFSKLKQAIRYILEKDWTKNRIAPTFENFQYHF